MTGVLLVSGCTVTGQVQPAPSSPTNSSATRSALPLAARSVQAQAVLDAWTTAVRSHDGAAYSSVVSARDPAFVARSAALWANLDRLPLTGLTLTLGPRVVPLSSDRQSLLGEQAWVQETVVTWRLTGETTSAIHRVWTTFVPDENAVRLAGTTDGDSLGPEPLWWAEPVTTAVVRRSVALVAGQGTQAEAQARIWAGRAAAAAQEVSARLDSRRPWPARLVIEVPVDQDAFERVLGVTPGSYASIAAVAWPEGSDPATAALRIIVNPSRVKGLPDEGLAILLAHEATHVATRSASSSAPTWLVEGYADFIAYEAHPSTRATAAAAALGDVATSGPPSGLPTDADFAPGAAELDLTYARAWLACRYLAASSSARDLHRLYEAVDGGATLDDALRSVLGIDETAFLRGWRSWLTAAARDR